MATHGAALISILLVGACAGDLPPRPGTPPRNVLLITASNLRRDHLSAYLYPRPTGAWPAHEEERRQGRALAFDDLAAQGVLFADASTCAPQPLAALRSLFTGTRFAYDEVTARAASIPPEATTLAEHFRAAGFRAAAFTAGVSLRDGQGFAQGFEPWEFRMADAAVLDLARQWIQQAAQQPEQPWFVWVHLAGCDRSYDPRGQPPLPGDGAGVLDFSRLYADAGYSGPADGSLAYLEKLERGEATASDADRARLIDLYDGEVARVAAGVRGLALSLRNLDESGARWNETLTVFAGLHGVQFGERDPREFGSESLAIECVGVPLWIRHPPSLTGSRVLAEPVGLEDVAPTLCEWFGLAELPAPPLDLAAAASGGETLRGRSLLPLVDTYVQRPFASRPAWFHRTGERPLRALRTREWAFAERWADGAAKPELFDRAVDSAERDDVLAREPAVVERLLREWSGATAAVNRGG